jgi:hypothetical protein
VLGFSIRYPETLQSATTSQAPSDQAPIAIDAPAPGVPVDPETYRRMKDQARLQQVSFQAAGAAPTLIVEVFRKEPATSLRSWLQSFGVIGSSTDGRAVHSSGAGEGIRVGDDTWYFAGVAQVYALTIRGPDADRILGSFRVLSGR